MAAGIQLTNCKNVFISNCTALHCDIAIEANNSHSVQVDGLNASECSKGIVLNNCWDSDLKNLNIKTRQNSHFKISLLSYTVKCAMHGINNKLTE